MTIFNANQMQGFTLEVSDREIYNDIRSECDITEILTIRPDATPEFFETFTAGAWADDPILKQTTLDIVATADPDHTEIVWLNIVSYSFTPVKIFGYDQMTCEDLGGAWRDLGSTTLCMLPQSIVQPYMSWRIKSRETTYCTIEVINDSPYHDVTGVWYISYLAVSPETRYIKLRSTDATSILKYGRRVMDKPWPLGIHPVMMQSLIDSDCERYSEPVSMASMTLEGKDDANVNAILLLRMDGKHQFIHPRLDMDEEFFINNINIRYAREGSGIITGTFDLEQVRDSEKLSFFIIGSSLIGGTHVIAP